VGSALLEAVTDLAHTANCRRVWLITTNDPLKDEPELEQLL